MKGLEYLALINAPFVLLYVWYLLDKLFHRSATNKRETKREQVIINDSPVNTLQRNTNKLVAILQGEPHPESYSALKRAE
jgi:hypothetical protein